MGSDMKSWGELGASPDCELARSEPPMQATSRKPRL